jgi:hypothetical protein
MAYLTNVISGGSDIYGRRPEVPGPIDYGTALNRAIQQNISAIPGLTELGTQSTELYSRMMETAYPGITNLKNLGTSQIASFLRGEIPQDVSEQVQRIGAERGATSGTSGSPFNKALTARDLGMTSLGLIQGGLSAAERWVNQARAQTFDFSRMFYGPQDAQRQAENEWQRQWLANQVAAAPDPTKRGRFDQQAALMGMILSVYGGGSGYTQGYRPSYGQNGQSGAGVGGSMRGASGSYFGGGGEAGGGYDYSQDFGPDLGSGGAPF